jgi:hypothetical protein
MGLIMMNAVPRTRGNPNLALLQRIRSIKREVQSFTIHILRLERYLPIAIEECNALRETNAAVSAYNVLLQSQAKPVQQFNAVCTAFSFWLTMSHL